MAQYLTDEQFDEVMTKLFEAVGKKFHSTKRNCKGNWYSRSEWTQEQEKEFEDWLVKYIVKKLHIPVRLARKKAAMFCFDHGWRYKANNATL